MLGHRWIITEERDGGYGSAGNSTSTKTWSMRSLAIAFCLGENWRSVAATCMPKYPSLLFMRVVLSSSSVSLWAHLSCMPFKLWMMTVSTSSPLHPLLLLVGGCFSSEEIDVSTFIAREEGEEDREDVDASRSTILYWKLKNINIIIKFLDYIMSSVYHSSCSESSSLTSLGFSAALVGLVAIEEMIEWVLYVKD